jgi:hypothetical protein
MEAGGGPSDLTRREGAKLLFDGLRVSRANVGHKGELLRRHCSIIHIRPGTWRRDRAPKLDHKGSVLHRLEGSTFDRR